MSGGWQSDDAGQIALPAGAHPTRAQMPHVFKSLRPFLPSRFHTTGGRRQARPSAPIGGRATFFPATINRSLQRGPAIGRFISLRRNVCQDPAEDNTQPLERLIVFRDGLRRHANEHGEVRWREIRSQLRTFGELSA